MRDHNFYMSQCISLGKEAMEKGNPPVGAMVVKNNQIIGIGLESGKSSKDITRHAEIEAVKDALNNSLLTDLKDCVLYTTHEPCIMCSYVLRHYKLSTIVYGTSVKYIGGVTSEFKILNAKNIPQWSYAPKIVSGILEEQCQTLSNAYKHKITNHEN
ncbi:nucleoside deaminase [Pseudotenacibaculum haliotis]|uniref:Nucleoside deaminase n=1 Tax=Pseudotenacibaculum haliotis TaxID=1862138 RepID=A0ABW5LY43_9FLAO